MGPGLGLEEYDGGCAGAWAEGSLWGHLQRVAYVLVHGGCYKGLNLGVLLCRKIEDM